MYCCAFVQEGGPSEIRRHIFQVSTYQMCLLMLFNRQERWTYEVCSSLINFAPHSHHQKAADLKHLAVGEQCAWKPFFTWHFKGNRCYHLRQLFLLSWLRAIIRRVCPGSFANELKWLKREVSWTTIFIVFQWSIAAVEDQTAVFPIHIPFYLAGNKSAYRDPRKRFKQSFTIACLR